MYFIIEGDDKLKIKINEYLRICLLIIIISLIGISYTLYYAFQHNGEVTYSNYGINEVINVNPSLTFIQVLVILILGLAFVGAIVFLAYTKGGKENLETILQDNHKSIFYILETLLMTILLTLIIVIPSNILLEKYNTSDNYHSTVQSRGNNINNGINWNY